MATVPDTDLPTNLVPESDLPDYAPPKQKETKKPFKERATDVGIETGLGAAAGAFAPELMTGSGMVLSAFPATAPAGVGLMTAGQMLRGGRLASAGLGALGGFAGSAGGETAEAMGASPTTVEAIRLGGSLVAPEFASTTTYLLKKGVQKVLGLETGAAVRALARDMGLDEAKLTPSQRAFIERQINDIRGKAKAGVPQQQIFADLDAEAQRVMQEAKSRAAGVERAGTAEGLEQARKAARTTALGEETVASGQEAVDQAKSTVGSVGDITKQISNIGNSIRDKITERFSAQSLSRSEGYVKQQAVRDAAVAEKESSGVFVETLPEYKSLINDLRNKLLIGQTAQQQKIAPVTEKGVLQAYQNIYDAVTSRKIATKFDKDKKPIEFKTFPTSFQALDDVRRRLGDVAFGKEVEGYAAIGSNLAEKYYAKLSEIQTKFAGEAQEVLQRDYEMASRLLEKYKSKAGAKATALDRFDPTRYKTDSASLPKDYFKTRQSVDDLVQLTGDRNFVVKEAGDYAATEIRNLKDAAAVRNWVNKNSDWLKSVPEVEGKINSYLQNLDRAEAFAARTKKAGKGIEARGKEAIAEGKAIESLASKEAGKITKEAQQMADRLIGSKEAPLQIKNMILSGDRAIWDAVAPVLLQTPKGKEVLADAVGQVMADRAATGLRSAGVTFRDAVAPALRRTQLMDERAINKLQTQLDEIAKTAINEEQKLNLAQRLVKDFITGYVVPSVYRGGKSAYQVITGAGQPTSMQPGR
jgi:transposase-like protein